MKHFKTNKTTEKDIHNLDHYEYGDFDDDYYFDLVEDRNKNRSKRKRPPENRSKYARAFQDYVKDY